MVDDGPPPRRHRLAHDLPLVVEHDLADRRRLDRHGQRLGAGGRRNLGGAGEAGPDVRNLPFNLQRHLEVGGLGRRRGPVA